MSAINTPVRTRPLCDISSWEEVNISTLRSREKKRFHKRKDAVIAYLTTDTPLEQIGAISHLSPERIRAMSDKCLLMHEDGTLWGYRALLPGTHVIDHSSQPSNIAVGMGAGEDEGGDPCGRPLLSKEDEHDDHLLLDGRPQGSPLHSSSTPIPTEQLDVSVHEQQGDSIASNELQDQPEEVNELDEQTEKRPVVLTLIKESPAEPEIPALEAVETTPGEPPETPRPAVLSEDEEEPIKPATELALVDVVEVPALVALAASDTSALVLSKYVKRKKWTRSTGRGQQRRTIHKHWEQKAQFQRQKLRVYRYVSLAVVAVILLATLLPLGTGIAAYSIYTTLRTQALDGVNHLLNVKAILPISKSDPMAALDPTRLHQAQNEFRLAKADFLQLQQLVNRPDIQAIVNQVSPDYGNKLLMARHLLQVALDVSRMGDEMSGIALLGSSVLHGSPLASGSTQPLISVTDVAAIEGSLIHALYYIGDIRTRMSQVQLKDLPISDKQKAQIISVLALLPQAQDIIVQAQGLTSTVAWLLGVGHARRFLVQTMDRGELRPSGGFTGQYGILQVQDGRVAPFSLRDVALLDYAGNGVELGRSAPPQYSNWMNFGDWGLRDSNLSADYPTTAQISMQVFQDEGGGPVDGDISFTPTFIGHILDVTGPIHVVEYNETITSKNLEERLHYYQQNYTAIALQKQKTNDDSHAVRKAFTSLVGKLLLDRVRHLSTKQLVEVVKNAIKDIQSRDLEIYFANPTAEAWLVQHGYSGGTDTFTKQDGFMVVQANISISKASQYVHTTEHDDVVLDAQGGATHNLTITLDYQQTGPVYGFDTYADYIRVYVPEQAQFLSGDGFDTGRCLPIPHPTTGGTTTTDSNEGCCTAGIAPSPKGGKGGTGTPSGNKDNGCSIYRTSFPSNARYCPDGNYDLGDRNFQVPWKIDSLGAPTSLTSDLPGRAMWGGLTETPKNCTTSISLSWYVPHVVHTQAGQSPYALLVQKQGGYIPTVEITVDSSALPMKGLQPFSIHTDLIADKVFAVFVAKK